MALQRLLELLYLSRLCDLRHHRIRHHKRVEGQRAQEGQTLHVHEIDEHVCVRHDNLLRRRGWPVLRPREHDIPHLFTVIEHHVLEHECELRR
jgi:hypothetical protein